MKKEFDSWLNLDSASNQPNILEEIQSPSQPNYEWETILKPEQKHVLDESI
jgi:hypothetical protein